MEYHVACAKGPKIPRDFFHEVYRLIHENGHWETVFYDNGIHDTPLDLLEFLTRKEVLPFSVWADDLLVGLLWVLIPLRSGLIWIWNKDICILDTNGLHTHEYNEHNVKHLAELYIKD